MIKKVKLNNIFNINLWTVLIVLLVLLVRVDDDDGKFTSLSTVVGTFKKVHYVEQLNNWFHDTFNVVFLFNCLFDICNIFNYLFDLFNYFLII